jgi:hypothetical protein
MIELAIYSTELGLKVSFNRSHTEPFVRLFINRRCNVREFCMYLLPITDLVR